jgi:PIN domain nuclease of toxin-antitoxin system
LKLSLDTNVFLWATREPGRLTDDARMAIVDPANEVYVSAVVAWEIAIKLPTGKRRLPPDVGGWFLADLRLHNFEPLAITVDHVTRVEHLPRHHADPFDRLLVAQAQAEGLVLVTGDPKLQAYPVPLLPCWR